MATRAAISAIRFMGRFYFT